MRPGKLPPGAKQGLRRTLNELKESHKLGVLRGVKILPGPGCAVSEAQRETVYPIDRVPTLPLLGCDRDPCCGCDYAGVVK